MWNKNSEKEGIRLSILETMFIEFQKQLGIHMNNEDKLFQEIKASIKDLSTMFAEVQKENERGLEDLSAKLLFTVEKNFVSKIELNSILVSQQKETLQEILSEKKRSVTELYYIVAAFIAAGSAIGWLLFNFKL